MEQGASVATVADGRRRRGTHRRRALRLTQIVVGVVAVGVGMVVVWGHRDELRGARSLLEQLHVPWVVMAAAAELASMVAFAALQKSLLRGGGTDVGLPTLTAISFAGNAITNSLPGGPAWGSVFAYRQFRRNGASRALAGWVLIAVSGVSGATLAALAFGGIELAGNEGPASGLRVVAICVLVVAVAVVALMRRPGALARLAERVVSVLQRRFGRPRGSPAEIVEASRTRLRAVQPDTSDWAAAVGFSMLNWIADCACLCASFLAVGADVPWRGLLLAYGAAQLAANLPITPGGLGIVEGSLALALVAYGGGEDATVAAIVLYRIISFWSLLPIGWLAWAGLEAVGRRRREEP